jgi:DNA-nicking Smr family endonuclease
MKKKQHPQKPREFAVAPFKVLNGIAVSPPFAAPPPVASTMPPPPAEDEDDLDLFFRAVSDVRPLVTSDQGEPRKGAATVVPSLAVRARKFEEEDRKLFLKALEGIDVRFQDEIPDDDTAALPPISASRLKQLRQGTIRIRMELDLHGLTRDQALDSLGHFIDGAWKREMKAVLVITGKGNNSSGEPILQAAVAGWLRDKGKKLVVEFAPAPRQMGGTGAFVVFLRPHEQESRQEQT